MSGLLAGLSTYGHHVGVGSSYGAFIAALGHVAARLHAIGNQARQAIAAGPYKPFILVCAHAGVKTGEDGPTHADPQALQLLQGNFPLGTMITLTPWDPQEIWTLVSAALARRPAVIAPFVTRPSEKVIDRPALGLAPVTAAANGRLPPRARAGQTRRAPSCSRAATSATPSSSRRCPPASRRARPGRLLRRERRALRSSARGREEKIYPELGRPRGHGDHRLHPAHHGTLGLLAAAAGPPPCTPSAQGTSWAAVRRRRSSRRPGSTAKARRRLSCDISEKEENEFERGWQRGRPHPPEGARTSLRFWAAAS